MRRLSYLAALALAAYLGAVAGASVNTLRYAYGPEAVCGTDTECMRHCPPPMDDPDCDGGPDDGAAQPARKPVTVHLFVRG